MEDENSVGNDMRWLANLQKKTMMVSIRGEETFGYIPITPDEYERYKTRLDGFTMANCTVSFRVTSGSAYHIQLTTKE